MLKMLLLIGSKIGRIINRIIMTIRPFVDYKDLLIEDLQDPKEAAAYLNAAMEEGEIEMLVLALQDVAEAQGRTG